MQGPARAADDPDRCFLTLPGMRADKLGLSLRSFSLLKGGISLSSSFLELH